VLLLRLAKALNVAELFGVRRFGWMVPLDVGNALRLAVRSIISCFLIGVFLWGSPVAAQDAPPPVPPSEKSGADDVGDQGKVDKGIDEAAEATTRAIDKAKDAMIEAIEKARAAVKAAVEKAKQETGPALDKAKEKTSRALDKAKQATGEVLDAAKRASEEALDAAKGDKNGGTLDAEPPAKADEGAPTK
jgi:hypothetical protein